ncbi:erythrocyte binding protein 1 [Lachnospiraceae bacterium KM106-2]|nr:erythrocyte binding protein 1 [Lachnospiraceae bacterium KM106-2]
MVKDLFINNIFIYVIAALFGLGVIAKLIVWLSMKGLIRKSKKMATSKSKLLQTIRLKFETCYKLKLGVNNVDIFVDKYVYRHKFCGILLSTWDNLCGQLVTLCLLIGFGSGVLGVIENCEQKSILYTILTGAIAGGLLISFDLLTNIKQKKQVLVTNIKDYLENFLKISLENEALSATLIEQYHNEIEGMDIKMDKKKLAEKKRGDKKQLLKEELAARDSKKVNPEDMARERREAKKNELKQMIRDDKKPNIAVDKSKSSIAAADMKKTDQDGESKRLKDRKTKYVMTEEEEKLVEEILKEYLA